MKKRAFLAIATAALLTLSYGCVATIPVKAATKGAKLGVKTAKAGVKTTVKAGAAVIPDSDEKKD